MSEWNRIQNNLSTVSRENQRIEFHPATKPHTSFNVSSKLSSKKVEDKTSNTINKKKLVIADPISGPAPGLFPPATVFDFLNWTKISRGGSGLFNHGNTCFLNSVLQCLLHVPPLTQILLNEKIGSSILNTVKNTKSVIHYYHRLVQEVWVQSTGRAVSPRCIVQNIRQIGRQFRPTRQEDAHEFLRQLLDTMHEEILKANRIRTSDGKISETSLICRIFGGYLQNHLKCPQCPYSSRTYNHFQDLSLEISGQINSVEEALSEYSRPEKLGTGNEWACEGCKKRVLAIKQLTVCRAPAVLVLHLKRFSFGGRSSKIVKKIKFDEYLNLNLSDENSSDIFRIHGYKHKQKHQPPNSNSNNNNKTPGASTSSSGGGDGGSGVVRYKLIGVVVHHGMSMHSGHYIAYVRSTNDQWLLMDDNHVSVTSLKNVLEQQAYILFYSQVVPAPVSAPVPLSSASLTSKSMPVTNSTTNSLSRTPTPTAALPTPPLSSGISIESMVGLEISPKAHTGITTVNPDTSHPVQSKNKNKNTIVSGHIDTNRNSSTATPTSTTTPTPTTPTAATIQTLQPPPNTTDRSSSSSSSSSSSIPTSVVPLGGSTNVTNTATSTSSQYGNSNESETSSQNISLLNGHINSNSTASSAMEVVDEEEEEEEALSEKPLFSSLSLTPTKKTKTRLVEISSDKIRVHRFLSPCQRLLKWVKGSGSRLPLLRRKKTSLKSSNSNNNSDEEKVEGAKQIPNSEAHNGSNTSTRNSNSSNNSSIGDLDSQEVVSEEEDEGEGEASQYDDNIASSNSDVAKNTYISSFPVKSISTTTTSNSCHSSSNNINFPSSTIIKPGSNSSNVDHSNHNINKLMSLLGKRGKGELEEGHWEHIHPNIISEKVKMKISQRQAEQSVLQNRQTSEWDKMLDRGRVKKMKTKTILSDNYPATSDNDNYMIIKNNPFQNALDSNNNKSHFDRNVFGNDVSNHNINNNGYFKEGRKSKYKKY